MNGNNDIMVAYFLVMMSRQGPDEVDWVHSSLEQVHQPAQ